MADDCHRFRFLDEFHPDAPITLDVAWDAVQFVFYLPGQLILSGLEMIPDSPLHINCTSGTAWGATLFGAIFWLAAFQFLIATLSGVVLPRRKPPKPKAPPK
jgi:hypothetical protein